MTREEIRRALLAAIVEIAPETDPATIEPSRPLRAQVDIDSADWLHLLVAIDRRLGVDIPDAEAARLRTLQQLVDQCAVRLGA